MVWSSTLLCLSLSPALRNTLVSKTLHAAPPHTAATHTTRHLSRALHPKASAPLDDPLLAEIEQTVAEHKIVVYSKSWCPFCARTLATLADLALEPHVVDLDELENGAEIQMALAVKTGQRTVPNVFVKGGHLGGNDDTQRAARSGALQQMLS